MKKCFLCDSSQFEKIGTVNVQHTRCSYKSSLLKCLNCGLFWIDPAPDQKKLSKAYGGAYHYNPSKIKDVIISRYLSFDLKSDFNLIKRRKKEGRVLDIGAGRGDFLLTFPADKFERWAYDPYLSAKDVGLVRKKIGPRVNNYRDLKDYPAEFFDLVIVRNVIEHTFEFMRLLRFVSRLLKKDGVLFIRTPNMDSLDFKFFKVMWYTIKMVGHIVFFNKKTLTQALNKAGLSVTYIKATSRSAPSALLRSVKLPLPFPINAVASVIYSFISPLLGEGGDLRVISQK